MGITFEGRAVSIDQLPSLLAARAAKELAARQSAERERLSSEQEFSEATRVAVEERDKAVQDADRSRAAVFGASENVIIILMLAGAAIAALFFLR